MKIDESMTAGFHSTVAAIKETNAETPAEAPVKAPARKTAADYYEDPPKNTTGERLRSLVDRIERLDEERKALSADIKEVFHEAKAAGFDVKVMRRLLADRKREAAELEEEEQLLEVYRRAIEGLQDL